MSDDQRIHINFEKLENEVKSAINADEKYWRENSTKLRAIEQRVGTYEDFRQMVLASHLKPLDKGETLKSDLNKNTWNILACKSDGDDQFKLNNSNEMYSKHKMPVNSMEFIQTWKKLPDLDSHKWEYINGIGAKNIGNLFANEINGDILGQFLVILKNQVQTVATLAHADYETILELLETFPKCNRFKLNLLFLKKTELDACKLLFEELFKKFTEKQPGNKIDLKALQSFYV
jgi:hypothetical protein